MCQVTMVNGTESRNLLIPAGFTEEALFDDTGEDDEGFQTNEQGPENVGGLGGLTRLTGFSSFGSESISGTRQYDDDDGSNDSGLDYALSALGNLNLREIEKDQGILNVPAAVNMRQMRPGDNGLSIWTGMCVCEPGYIPFRNPLTSEILECRDPIVLTSIVGARCLKQEHCSQLPNTECRTFNGNNRFSACQCKFGYREGEPEEGTDLIRNCIEDTQDISIIIAKLEEELSASGIGTGTGSANRLTFQQEEVLANRGPDSCTDRVGTA